MRNTLTDLNNYLFEALERLNDDDLDDEQLDKEIRRAESTTKIAEKIIENGELAFKTMKHLNEYGYDSGSPSKDHLAPIPPMLEAGK